MFVALKDRRIVRPVILEIKLEVVSRPGVLFCEQNAAAKNAWPSPDPRVVNFDVVKAKSYFDIPKKHQYLYQAEVLVPSSIPPHLIRFPKVDAWNKPIPLATTSATASQGTELTDVPLTGDRPSPPPRPTSREAMTVARFALATFADLCCGVIGVDENGVPLLCNEETFIVFPCCGRPKCNTHAPVDGKCGCEPSAIIAKPKRPNQPEARKPSKSMPWCRSCQEHVECADHDGVLYCQFAVTKGNPNCPDCKTGLIDCELHMTFCGKPAWNDCGWCQRFRCHGHAEGGCCEESRRALVTFEKKAAEEEENKKKKAEERAKNLARKTTAHLPGVV